MAIPLKFRLKRWLLRTAIVLTVLILILLALPFLFTTTLVRFALAQTPYARFSPLLDSASLSPSGALTLRGLALHEPDDPTCPQLLTANAVRIEFNWFKVFSSRLKSIQATGLIVYARSDPGRPLTLLRLAEFPNPSPPNAKAPPVAAAPAAPFWFDTLTCEGDLVATPPDNLTLPNASWPLHLQVSMSGPAINPVRDITLLVGDPPAPAAPSPSLHLQARIETTPAGPVIHIASADAHNLRATLAAPLARNLFSQLPPEFQRQLDASVDSLSMTGLLTASTPPRFTGQVSIQNLSMENASASATGTSSMRSEASSLKSPAPAASEISNLKSEISSQESPIPTARVKNANLSATLNIPLTANALKDALITDGLLSAAEIASGPQHLSDLSTHWALRDGELVTTETQLHVATGTLQGQFRCDLLTAADTRMQFTFTHISPNALYAGLIPADPVLPTTFNGTFSAQRLPGLAGDYSGQITLTAAQLPSTNYQLPVTNAPATAPATSPTTSDLTLTFRTQDSCRQILIDAAAHHIQTTLSEKRSNTLLASLPPEFRRAYSADLVAAGLTGTLTLSPDLHFSGELNVDNFSLSPTPPSPATQDSGRSTQNSSLSGLSLRATLDLPITPNPLPDLTIRKAVLQADQLTYLNYHLTHIVACASLQNGELNATETSFDFAGGNLFGHLQYNLLTGGIPESELNFRHISPGLIDPRLAPAGLTFATAYNGQISLRRTGNPAAEYAGHIALAIIPADLVEAANAAQNINPPHFDLTPPNGPAPLPSLDLQFHTFDQSQKVAIERLRLHDLHALATPDFLARFLPHAPTYIAKFATLDAEDLQITGTLEPFATPAHLTAQMKLTNLTFAAASPSDRPLALRRFSLAANIDTPLDATAPQFASVQAGTLAFDELTLADNTSKTFSTQWTFTDGVLHVASLNASAFGGTITGRARYDLVNKDLTGLDLDLKHIDQHELLKNINPEKVDATGSISGPVHFVLSHKDHKLHIDGDLQSDAPGRLKIGDETVRQAIAGQFAVDITNLPPNWSDIFMAQLKDYPYSTCRIRLGNPEGAPVMILDYEHADLVPGDPGYDIKMIREMDVAGVPVKAEVRVSLKCNLKNTTVHVPMPLESLLNTATGLQSLLK